MHLHPTVASLMIKIGAEFGLTRIRVPAEPPAVLKACGDRTAFGDEALYRWTAILRRKAKRAGLATTDHVFGLKWSGHMTPARIKTLLKNLPDGSSEIYFHPATRQDETLRRLMPGYEHAEELRALLETG
jgi:hypothetical protein